MLYLMHTFILLFKGLVETYEYTFNGHGQRHGHLFVVEKLDK